MKVTTPSTAPTAPPIVLVVDDHAAWRDLLAGRLRRHGAATCTAGSVEEAIARIERTPVDLVVTDHRMPGASGLDLLAYVRLRRPGLAVVLTSAAIDDGLIAAGNAGGAAAVIQKDELLPTLTRLTHLLAPRAVPEDALARAA